MKYTLHQLEIFHKVCELKSITLASEALYLSQPAVSIQLKNFQDCFQVPLYEVVGRKVHITEFGEEIRTSTRTILDEVDVINNKAAAYLGQLTGKLKIAIVSTAKYVMPYFLTDFINNYSGVSLSIDVTNKSGVLHSLEQNEIDFAMVSTIPDHLKIERIPLMDNELYLVGGKNYTHNGAPLSHKDIAKLPLIFREEGSATRKKMEQFMASNKIMTAQKMEMKSNEALKQAVIAGLGFSIMPLIGIKNELKNGELQIIPAEKLPIKTNWNLIWLSAKKLSPAAQKYIQYLKENKAEIIRAHFDWCQ